MSVAVRCVRPGQEHLESSRRVSKVPRDVACSRPVAWGWGTGQAEKSEERPDTASLLDRRADATRQRFSRSRCMTFQEDGEDVFFPFFFFKVCFY